MPDPYTPSGALGSGVHVAPGRYMLRPGVLTANGNLYLPVDRAVDVKDHGATVVQMEVELPPRVEVRFDPGA